MTPPTPEALFVSGERVRTRAELDERSRRAASGLRGLGVGPGDAVALLLRNELAFFEATYSATAVGAYPVPINWHLAAAEIGYVLSDCGARVLIAHVDLLERLPEVLVEARRQGITVLGAATPPELTSAFGLDPVRPDAGLPGWDEWLAGFSPLGELHGELTHTMFYTSGTTGRPKGVRRRARPRAQAARLATVRNRIYGIEPGVRAVVPGPLYHSAPNAFALSAAPLAERVVVMPRFDAATFLELVERHRITNAFMVPTMFVRLLKLDPALRERFDLSSLDYVMIAAAPCPPEVKRQMIDWWGPIVHEFYGATELGYMTVCSSRETLERPGTVGRPVPGVVIKALDAAGREVATGEPGELYGRMAEMPDFTYHNRPEERAAVERDGLVTCGDVGYFDTDGYLYLCDRVRDMVISGGVNIYPAEIEAVLVSMPGVADCAVFGVPDAEYGERLHAVVMPQPGHVPAITGDDVIAYLRSRLAGFKVPREIEIRDDLPREDSGKIYKRRLRDAHWTGMERRI